MSLRIVGTLVLKDLRLFLANRFYAVVTPLALVSYMVIYFVMPSSVDETLDVGAYSPVEAPGFAEMQGGEGLNIEMVDSEEALREAVIDGEYVAGVAVSSDMLAAVGAGQKARATLYFASDTPEDVREAVVTLFTQLALPVAGPSPAIEFTEKVLGPDMVGMQIPHRDRMVPLLAFALLLFETFGLATLISEEAERRTIQALLITPATVRDLFTAKAVVGVGLAFVQAALFMAIVGGLSDEPLMVLTALLLGAVLVTGVGFLMAALGKDLMSVMGWGIVVMVPLSIPAFGVIFPGTVSGWAEVVPSYYLVETVHQASNVGAGWGDIWQNLMILLGFNVAIVWVGIMALRRKFQ